MNIIIKKCRLHKLNHWLYQKTIFPLTTLSTSSAIKRYSLASVSSGIIKSSDNAPPQQTLLTLTNQLQQNHYQYQNTCFANQLNHESWYSLLHEK